MSEQEDYKNIQSNQKYTPPVYKKSPFYCPHCEVYADQKWSEVSRYEPPFIFNKIDTYLKIRDNRGNDFDTLHYDRANHLLKTLMDIYRSLYIKDRAFSFCAHCKKYSIWVDEQMVYPGLSTASLPIEEMPETVKELYNEAREISGKSPRGACALLSLAVQLLVKEFGEDERNLNKAIGNLVKKGLPEKIQKALDSVRVIGNNAVHPGKINIKDKPEVANSLFMLVNFISEKMIKDVQKVDDIYGSLPENAIEGTKQRDEK